MRGGQHLFPWQLPSSESRAFPGQGSTSHTAPSDLARESVRAQLPVSQEAPLAENVPARNLKHLPPFLPYAVNGLQARTFGIWTLLSSVIRCLCAIDIRNKTLYHITLWTFLLALGHFLSEVFVYGTAAPTIGVLAPLMVASFSIMGMLIGLQYLEVEPVSRSKKRN
uniref:Ergosterol biosynthesis 28 homolog n=1 Tax=Ornithorhynchus anatinus TaxID=9258 RepID=A0A6I8PAR3_ORNAN